MEIRKVPTSRFTWVKEENVFCAEMSQFARPGQSAQFFGPVDDLGMGIVLVSDRTSAEIAFRIYHVEWSHEQELLSWHLCPCASQIKNNPEIKDLRVVIYND